VDPEPVVEVVEQPPSVAAEQWGGQDLTQHLTKQPSETVYVNMPDIVPPLLLDDEPDWSSDDMTKAAQRQWKIENPEKTLKEQRHLLALGKIEKLPWEDYLHSQPSDTGFGPGLPAVAAKGEMWIRTDELPTRLYKYNGEKWIEVTKSQSDTYAFNDQYIDYLIAKIGSGEYDPELLTDAERSQIESRLRREI
jgi:hypothetical protein